MERSILKASADYVGNKNKLRKQFQPRQEAGCCTSAFVPNCAISNMGTSSRSKSTHVQKGAIRCSCAFATPYLISKVRFALHLSGNVDS